jgi:4-amino-4-deoxy-L-arabinose transferase-like glycosyltransferase
MMPRLQLWWAMLGASQRQAVGVAGGLALLLGVLLVGFQARYGLFDVDEAIFTQATIEMRSSEQLAMPTYNGVPRYHKPPLIYWLQDAAMRVVGAHGEALLWAARLPSALSMWLTVLLLGWGVWWFTRDYRWALASAAVLGLNLSVLVVGRAATADGVLNLTSLALALWVVRVLFYPVQRSTWMVTAALTALGLLAKGPVVGVPAAVVFAMVWAARASNSRKQRWEALQRLQPVRVVAMTLLLLAPWVWLLVHQVGWGFFSEFLWVHNVGRFASDMGNTQSSSHFYYLLVLLVGLAPWVWLVIPATLRALAGWRMARFVTALGSRDVAKALPLLALGWAVAYVGVFSFSGTKLAHYIVPAYPALALLIGWWLTLPRNGRAAPGWIPTWVGVLGVVWLLVLALVVALLNPLLVGLAQPQLVGWLAIAQTWLGFAWPPSDPLAMMVLQLRVPLDVGIPLLAGLLVGCVVPAWGWLVWGPKAEREASLVALAVSWGMALLLVVLAVVPQVWARTQAPLAQLAQQMRVLPMAPIIHLGLHKPSVRLLSGRSFIKLERPLQLPDTLARLGPVKEVPVAMLLTEATTVPDVVRELGMAGAVQGAVVGQDCAGGYCLLTIQR